MAFEKETFFYQSSDGKTPIAAYIYTPRVGSIRAIIQISHGMSEYLERYEGFIEFMCERGYLVCGNDHLGHGATAKTRDDLGFIAEKDGHQYLMEDLYLLTQIVKLKYPNTPYILFGHSMGSLVAKLYSTKYGEALNGLVLSGTVKEQAMANIGILLAKIAIKKKGIRGKSAFLDKASLGSYNHRIINPVTENDWLSNDPDVVANYNSDPLCGFKFTASGYRDLFTLIKLTSGKKWAKKLPRNIRIFIFSGDNDPVGGYGRGVEKIYHMIKSVGVQDVILKIYQEGRHEMLNEVNSYEVYKDVLKWCERIINLYKG